MYSDDTTVNSPALITFSRGVQLFAVDGIKPDTNRLDTPVLVSPGERELDVRIFDIETHYSYPNKTETVYIGPKRLRVLFRANEGAEYRMFYRKVRADQQNKKLVKVMLYVREFSVVDGRNVYLDKPASILP